MTEISEVKLISAAVGLNSIKYGPLTTSETMALMARRVCMNDGLLLFGSNKLCGVQGHVRVGSTLRWYNPSRVLSL